MRKLNVVRCGLSQKNVHDKLLHALDCDYVRSYEEKNLEIPLFCSQDLDAQALGRWFAGQSTVPDIFVVSTAKRVRQTLHAMILNQSRLETIPWNIDRDVIAIDGESQEQTCRRAQKWVKEVRKRYVDWHVCLITDHRFALAVRKVLERWDDETFLRISCELKPGNCDVAEYRGHRLSLEYFNRNYLEKERTQ